MSRLSDAFHPGSGVTVPIAPTGSPITFSGSYLGPSSFDFDIPYKQCFSEATEKLIGKLLNPTTVLEQLAVAVLRGDDPAAILALRDRVEEEYRG